MCLTAFHWSDELFERFVKTAMLNKEEIIIMDLYIKHHTVKEIAEIVNRSPSTVSRRIERLRKKYDSLIEDGYDFPPRRNKER